MRFSQEQSEVFVPSGADPATALSDTTDLCIAAHQDDVEIMAYGPIAACFDSRTRFFTGCVMTDGAGSPRTGVYADYTNEEMMRTRAEEQKNAARVGAYIALALMNLTSAQIKDNDSGAAVDDIEKLLLLSSPKIVYTHNLADKHDTHVAVALRVIEALRRLPAEKRPAKVYTMEVWRGLDWLCDDDKTIFDTSPHPNLAAALLSVYDSQIAGGKRYDSAALGRRLANATFFASHAADQCESLSYALDVTALINDGASRPEDFIMEYIENFKHDVLSRLQKLRGAI